MLRNQGSARILTTHTGSLPRPDDLVELLYRRDAGQDDEHDLLQARVRQAVAEVVETQVKHGLDIVNDGELGKVGYASDRRHRLWLCHLRCRRVVEPRIAWLKLDAMVEGARLASSRLWR
jgi:methionine synthase II (cobalamin-independent)